jgi:hypothetical protein
MLLLLLLRLCCIVLLGEREEKIAVLSLDQCLVKSIATDVGKEGKVTRV